MDDGYVAPRALRRTFLNQNSRAQVESNEQSERDPFWVAKLRAGPLWLDTRTTRLMQASRRVAMTSSPIRGS